MTAPAHRRFRLDPPHGDRIYWVAESRVPGDSRTEHVSADRSWFWRNMHASVPEDGATDAD